MRRASSATWTARVGLVIGLLAGCLPAWSQSTTARIEGLVRDDSGAIVPGVTVTATNTGTNFSRSAVTDSDGNYTLTPLPTGSYVVRAELSGFQPTSTRATLKVNDVARLDFSIKVGALTDVVEVVGVAPLIDKSTSSIGTVIDSQQVTNLPLNGRNFTQLATLSPGVNRGVPGGNASGESGNAETFRYGEVGGTAISVNGVREQGNTYYYDGLDNNERLVNSVVFFPSPEALQEFRVITANAAAEFGRSGGAVINLVTKSGSNEFGGSAYWFNRPRGLAATPSFAQSKPEFKRNDFGATFGGPLVKDRTFFFANYHGLRSKLPVEPGGLVTVPTALMRRGDFSELLNPSFTGQGRAIVIYDPVTGLPFPGNVIPANRLNPVGVKYLNAFPLPTRTDRATQNYLTNRLRDSNFDDADLRLDHNFSSSDQVFFRFSFSDSTRFDPGRIPGYQAGFGSGTATARAYGGALGYTKVLSPRVINEFRLGYSRYRYGFLPVGFGENQNQALGIPGPGGITGDNGISLIGGGNGNFIEYLGDFGPFIVTQKVYQLTDSLTLVRGRHNFKVGGTVLLADLAAERTQIGKGFYFFSDQTSPSPGRSGYEVADMLVGRTSFTATGIPSFSPRNTRSWENSLFVQDDWRVNEKLTLNLGLRWDLFTPYYEKDDRLANFVPTFGANGQITGGQLVLPGDGVSKATVDKDWNNFGPRLGFAYQVNDKTVVRGSWGIFYSLDRGGIDNQLTENPPYTVTQYRFDGPGSAVSLSEPIPLPVTVDPRNPVLPDGSGIVYVPRDTQNNRYQQFNLGVQRELSSTTAVTLGYVGTRGDNLTAVVSRAGFNGVVQGRITTVANVASSNYDSFQASLRRTSARGLSYLASYTWGHAINDSPGPFPGPGGFIVPTIANDLGVDKGNADYDIRHRFTLAATWPLPFAPDDPFLGGWSVNAIVTLQTGNWFSAFCCGGRPELVGDPNELTDAQRDAGFRFNPAAFRVVTNGANIAGRNIIQGPPLRTVDLSIFKTIKLGGRRALELRFEGFNILNTSQLQLNDDSLFLDRSNFGKAVQTRLNTERQVQLAARLTF
jgi:hypothetical protein